MSQHSQADPNACRKSINLQYSTVNVNISNTISISSKPEEVIRGSNKNNQQTNNEARDSKSLGACKSKLKEIDNSDSLAKKISNALQQMNIAPKPIVMKANKANNTASKAANNYVSESIKADVSAGTVGLNILGVPINEKTRNKSEFQSNQLSSTFIKSIKHIPKNEKHNINIAPSSGNSSNFSNFMNKLTTLKTKNDNSSKEKTAFKSEIKSKHPSNAISIDAKLNVKDINSNNHKYTESLESLNSKDSKKLRLIRPKLKKSVIDAELLSSKIEEERKNLTKKMDNFIKIEDRKININLTNPTGSAKVIEDALVSKDPKTQKQSLKDLLNSSYSNFKQRKHDILSKKASHANMRPG